MPVVELDAYRKALETVRAKEQANKDPCILLAQEIDPGDHPQNVLKQYSNAFREVCARRIILGIVAAAAFVICDKIFAYVGAPSGFSMTTNAACELFVITLLARLVMSSIHVGTNTVDSAVRRQYLHDDDVATNGYVSSFSKRMARLDF